VSVAEPGKPLSSDAPVPGLPPAERIDFERGMSPAPIIAIGLIVLNGAIFFVTLSLGFLQSKSTVLAAGALSQELVFQGEVWRLVTAMFLHGGLDHLAGNAVGLFILGMAAEHAYGKMGMARVYFLGGLVGSVFSALINPGPSVGASGAIFGLLGAMIVFFHKYRAWFHLRDKRIGNVLLMWAAYSVGTAYFIPFIDNAAHLGGLVGGAAVGWWITPKIVTDMDSAALN
jgi:rhomboid protease GluP